MQNGNRITGASQWSDLQRQLRGVLAFPITPFDANGRVDLGAVRDNAVLLAESGVHAVVAPSGTGEFFALTPQEIIAITRATVEAVGGRKPVIAAAGFGPTLAAELAIAAEQAGASAIMVVPPYYGRPDPEGLIAYYAAIAEVTDLGLIPYARDAAVFSPALFERLAATVPSVVAFKDGRGDVRLFQQIREHFVANRPDREMVWLAGAGDDLVGPYFAAGAEGFTSSLACFWPEASVELLNLAQHGTRQDLADFHARVVRPIYALRQRRPGYEVSVMKAAMEILGLVAGPARPPLANLSTTEREELAAILCDLKVPTREQRSALEIAD